MVQLIYLCSSSVNEDLQSIAECFVLITVKDWDLMSRDDFIGEALLSFDKISRDDHQQQSDESGQLLIPLTHPHLVNVTIAMIYVLTLIPSTNRYFVFVFKESTYLSVLETRSWDNNKASDFVNDRRRCSAFDTFSRPFLALIPSHLFLSWHKEKL